MTDAAALLFRAVGMFALGSFVSWGVAVWSTWMAVRSARLVEGAAPPDLEARFWRRAGLVVLTLPAAMFFLTLAAQVGGNP